jgi:DNA-binding GntR family transcriptional regulator
VVDHYEAMDIFLPVICHFAAVRRTDEDVPEILRRLEPFRRAVARKDGEAMIHANYDLHGAIAMACHNRSLEKAYRKMLVDKLRVGQHGIRGSEQKRDTALAERFGGTLSISEKLVDAIAGGDAKVAEALARELNTYVRRQVIDLLSASLVADIKLSDLMGKDVGVRRQRPGAPKRLPPEKATNGG